LCVFCVAVGNNEVGGQTKIFATLFSDLQQFTGNWRIFGFEVTCADFQALRFDEGVTHGAADEQRIDFVEQLRMTPILSLTLTPPKIATNGPLRILNNATQKVEFASHQQTGDARRTASRMIFATPSVEACARCAAPKASLT
jgi:hypothetical protein